MVFVGIDLGWTSQPSGVAALDESLRTRAVHRCATPQDALAWVDAQAAEGAAVVAVDAPLVIPNASGMRRADRLTHSLFGRYHAGCYPANQGLPFAARVTAFSAALQARGFAHGDTMPPGARGRYQIEVFPHAAAVQLFGLDCILKYKKGPVARRADQLRRFRRLLRTLVAGPLPRVPSGGAALKDAEDRLDAVLCAYVGWHWWRWGVERNDVLGAAAEGYIIVPRRRQAESIEA